MNETSEVMLSGTSVCQIDTWSPEETDALNRRLWHLFERQFSRKTQGDSTSLPVEEAGELMESIVYTLKLHQDAHNLPDQALLEGSADELFARAQRTAIAMLDETSRLYQRTVETVRTFESRSLADTLRGIGCFFRRYDVRLAAHQMPADIDYQLCHPIADSLTGVRYVREYLTRLNVENALLTRFDPERAVALLRRVSPLYGELLINLYEPVAANATGLAMLGGGETLLEITDAQSEMIAERLSGMPAPEARRALSAAAVAACRKLGLVDIASVRYLRQTAVALYPRLTAAPGSAKGVFASV